ncbi:MAG: methyltransferase domain-containing protein [Flavobacteriales bacterium]|jgi:SAM-dependent methyltransferase|nr:methyltransferase domain-containing protein [Flavobacteriales bacterium]
MEAEFDHIAKEYDATFTNTTVGRAQRTVVYQLLNECISDWNNLSILELNCGTGEDAVYLAQKGAKVLATDISPQMVQVTQKKTQGFLNIESTVLAINLLEKLGQKFDVIFSNFGGLNCLGEEEVKQFIINAHNSLNEGGKLILVIMPSVCLWESFYFSSKLKFGEAFRRRKKEGALAQVEDKQIRTYYYSPQFIQRNSEGFRLVKLAPVGFCVPPSYLDNWFKNKPKSIQKLIKLDKSLLKFNKLAALSDHFFICLEKL